MSSRRSDPPGQLEIPLVWELEPVIGGGAPSSDASPVASRSPEPVGTVRLVLAALADLGTLLLFFAATWLVAAAAGAEPRGAGQLAVIAIVAVEVASVVAVGLLWAWRGSPGLLLLNVGFGRPLAMSAAIRMWLCWLVGLPFAALPLLVGRIGNRPLERLGGAAVSFRSPRADA